MSLIAYGLIVLAILGSLAGLYGTIHHSGVKSGRAEVQDTWDKANEKSRQRALAKDEENRKKKEQADVSHAKSRRDLAGLYDAYTSLRDQRRLGSLLPAAPANAASPARATFDRAALDRGMEEADGLLQRGAEKILFRGDSAITDLNSAKEWARR